MDTSSASMATLVVSHDKSAYLNMFLRVEYFHLKVAVWSGVNIAGTRLREVAPEAGGENDPSNWEDLHKQVINRFCCLVILSRLSYIPLQPSSVLHAVRTK